MKSLRKYLLGHLQKFQDGVQYGCEFIKNPVFLLSLIDTTFYAKLIILGPRGNGSNTRLV